MSHAATQLRSRCHGGQRFSCMDANDVSRIIRRPKKDTPFRYIARRRKDRIRSWLARNWSDAQIVQAAQKDPLFESFAKCSRYRNHRGFLILSTWRIRKIILMVRKDVRERVIDGDGAVRECIETLDDCIQGARDDKDYKTVGFLIEKKTKLLGLHRINIDSRRADVESNSGSDMASIQKQLEAMDDAIDGGG